MANIHVSGLENTHPSVAIATETPKEKSIFAQEELAEENVVSEEDSAKAQFFNDLTAQLKKLAKNLDEARSKEGVSQDLSISRQLILNSVTNMLSSVDSLALTGEEQSILEQTGQEMENVLYQASHQKKVEVQPEKKDQIAEQMIDATDQEMAGVRVDAMEDTLGNSPFNSLPWLPGMDIPTTPKTPPPTTAKNDKDIAIKLSELLHKADKEYLQVYEYATKIRAEYQEKIAQIQQEIPKHISTDSSTDKDKKGNMKVDAKDIDDIITKTINLSNSKEAQKKLALYPPNYNTSGAKPLPATPEGKAEAEHWANELPGSKVQELKTKLLDWMGRPTNEEVVTGYIVVIDTQPLQNIRNALKLQSSECKNGTSVSVTTFQTWQTGFNSEIESIKTTTQEFSQAYNNANSTFSTLSKLLTSSVDTLFQSLAQYLRF